MKYLVLALVALFLGGCKTAEDEIFVIPENFTGYVIVIFNQPNGQEPVYLDNSRVYVIPPSGILRTKFKPNYGWSSESQFYNGSILSENRLPYVWRPDSIPAHRIVAHGLTSVGSVKGDTNTGFGALYFFVGNNAQITSSYSDLAKRNIGDLAD